MSKETLSQGLSYEACIDADLADLIPEYLDNRKEDITLIENALQNGAYGKIRTIGHSMKESGAGFGFDRITEIGHALEEAALKSNKSNILSSLDDLNDYLFRVHITYQEE